MHTDRCTHCAPLTASWQNLCRTLQGIHLAWWQHWTDAMEGFADSCLDAAYGELWFVSQPIFYGYRLFHVTNHKGGSAEKKPDSSLLRGIHLLWEFPAQHFLHVGHKYLVYDGNSQCYWHWQTPQHSAASCWLGLTLNTSRPALL